MQAQARAQVQAVATMWLGRTDVTMGVRGIPHASPIVVECSR